MGARRGSALLGTLQVSLLGRRSVYMCVIVLLVHGRVCLCICDLHEQVLVYVTALFCKILYVTVCVCVCVVRSDDPDILVSRLMRCEDECCCCRDTAGENDDHHDHDRNYSLCVWQCAR